MPEKLPKMIRTILMPVALLSAAMFLLSACGGSAPGLDEPLEDRIMDRWQHMIDRDFGKAWEYYTPGFRQLNPRETFAAEMAGRPVRWHAAELLEVECAEERCNALLRITVQPTAGPSTLRHLHVPSEVTETWLLLDGVWWFSQN